MPITVFTRFSPKISLNALGKTVETRVTLFAYNNTLIKQFSMCSVRVSFKGKAVICKIFVVEHEMAIVGITDSEKLGLVRVNFDTVDCSVKVKVINEITSDSFRKQIELEYPELFKGIGLMDGEISIKLKEGAIPHVEPVRKVPHAMQGTTQERVR